MSGFGSMTRLLVDDGPDDECLAPSDGEALGDDGFKTESMPRPLCRSDSSLEVSLVRLNMVRTARRQGERYGLHRARCGEPH